MKTQQVMATAFMLALALPMSGAVQAQRYSAESTARLIKAANEECRREFPNAIKQAIGRAACENHNMELLRDEMPYPDLMDQELAYNLVLAEKVQKGKMTLIEKELAATQYHSQIVVEQERRRLAAGSARAPQSPSNSAPRLYENDVGMTEPVYQPSPTPDAPRIGNNLPQTTRCQSLSVGKGMVQTICS